ncbi:MAG: hypothetical protein VB853_04890 [Pirellulales bacterium]
MCEQQEVDLGYRPDLPLPNAKGEIHPRKIERAIEGDSPREAADDILNDTLSTADRIVPGSAARRVISVRASRVGERIRYQILDEFETEVFLEPDTFDQPLTLGELIEMMQAAKDPNGNMGLVKSLWPDRGYSPDSRSQTAVEPMALLPADTAARLKPIV